MNFGKIIPELPYVLLKSLFLTASAQALGAENESLTSKKKNVNDAICSTLDK